MLNNLSNNNSGNATKSVVERKHYEDIEKRLDEMQDEIEMTEQGVSTNSQAIASLDGRVDAVENNSTFPTLNTDTINPATGDKIDVTGNVDVDGEIEANSVKTNSLTVNGTSFETVKDDAAQAKSTAETAKNKADEAYDLADALSDELADYKSDNEISITTGTLNADSVVTDSIAAQTINTNDFETTNAEIDKLYVDTIKATGFLELPTAGQSYYTITVPAKTTASFSGIYTSDNNTDYPFYFTVSDGAVIYKQGSTEIIKDISFDRETGYTKVRVKSSTNLTYISSALDNNPVTIEDGGDAYTDYAFIPQKTGGYLIRGYDDTTTEVYIAGVLKAYAMSVEEEIIERTSVDFLKVNASIELPKDWDAGGTISYSTGEENEYISAQTKAGVTKPTWTSPIHSTIGSLSYSSKLVDEATIASYKGISETRQTQTISITNEASLQQLTAFHWTKNGTYWQPYETTRITIGDHTMWIDPTESNQGIRFYDNQVIADGTWDDTPVEEANAVPVNLVIFDAPTELSFPITNLGDKTTVHGEITATCFKGNVLGNVTGNADTATNATCFDGKTYAEAKADILSGCAADSNMFNGKTYSEACADILSGNAATATNATCFDGHTYECAKADILSGCAACADNATCFDGCTYAQAKADILSGNAASATNATNATNAEKADKIKVERDTDTKGFIRPILFSNNPADAGDHTGYCCVLEDACCIWYSTTDHRLTVKNLCVCGDLCGCASSAKSADNAAKFNGCNYYEACADILAGTAAQAHCVDIDNLTASSYPLIMESTTCELGKSGTCQITFTPSTGILETNQVSTSCIENSGTVQSQCLCATCDINVDGDAYITGDLTVQGTITTTHSEEVVTPSENIILRDGATTPIASGCYSGFTITNYDGSNNLEVGADKDGTLHVGVVGGTMEPIATRATEACMEDGYAAHWDSTGTDLVTKGATSTHDLTVNGNASTTGNLSVTGNATVTGTLTADLTGTADNATCFGGCTYACAKADILSGNAASATNATCFNGCTYACAKADILSGCASEADNATCFGGCTYACAKADILSGCAADSAKLGNKSASCYIDNSSTAQTKAGNLKIGAPAACTSTSAGGAGVLVGSYGALQIFQDTPTIDLRYHKYCGEYSARLGNTAKGRFHIGVNDGEGCTGCTQSAIYCFNSDGTFKGATNICGTNIYQDGNKVIDTSSTTQTKAGCLYIGAPAACTSTSAGGSGITLGNNGAIELYHTTPVVDFHYNKYCGNYSHRFYAGKGLLTLGINDGDGCTGCSQEASYTFKSDGTFIGASTICASCNIYSAGCPVVTTGNIATVAPGYNCTGTSNYVVTTMVCCAKAVCRSLAASGTCHLAMFADNTSCESASAYVSATCPLTYEPATGALTACCVSSPNIQGWKFNQSVIVSTAAECYYLLWERTAPAVDYARPIMIRGSFGYFGTTEKALFDVSIDFRNCIPTMRGTVGVEGPSAVRIIPTWDSSTNTARIYFRQSDVQNYSGIWFDISCATNVPSTYTGYASMSGTPNDTWSCLVGKTYIGLASCNTEYPLVFSTCCATPAGGNRTLYNDSANNLMYNPSTNTLTACCVRGNSRVISGNPLACTSTQTGSSGTGVCSGHMEMFGSTPFIDFHVNNTCADYSHLIIANDGYLRVTSTNATGCTAATQTANFDFCSNGTFCANKVRVGSSYKFSAAKADNSGRPTLHLLRDITCAVCCSACGWSAIGKACNTRCPNPAGAYTGSRCIDFQVLMQYGTTGVSNAAVEILSQYASNLKPVIVTRNDGCVYFATCSTGSGCMVYDMQGACCVICEVCYNGTAYTDANGTYTIAKEGSLVEIKSCVSSATNATCFGGCTYAQAKADIAGSVETTPYTCINDVNAGAQDILMTSSTGTLGIVNASTGTNACPLTYNPATGELATSCVKVCNNSLIKGEVGGSAGSRDYPIMTLNSCCFQVYVGTSPAALPDDYSNVLTVKNDCINVGFSSRAGSASITLGSFSCACGENSIVIGRASNASSCMIVIGNSLSLCTGDEQSNCINAVVMSPHIDNCWAFPSHIFGCARIMFKYGTKQCTMYKFLNCLFSGRDFTDCAYAYASRLVYGDCCGRITGWDGLSYYAIRRNAAYSFCMDNHWSACHSCEDVIPTCCTNGYTSFDLVW